VCVQSDSKILANKLTLVEKTLSTSILEDILHRFQNRHRCRWRRKPWNFKPIL